VTPPSPPSPNQTVKALHPGTTRYTKGRESIHRHFQERMWHPKTSPSSVPGTQLSPWRLTSCTTLANAHTQYAGHHPSMKPTIGPAAANHTFVALPAGRTIDLAPRNTATHRGHCRLLLLALVSVVIVVGLRRLPRALPGRIRLAQ
jgi:hypothetical protein